MEKIAFLFPGQGAQYVGMSKNLYDNYAIVKETFHEADDVLGFKLSELCFEGSLVDLCKMENMFPALLVSAVASYRVYMKEIGITPQFCAGHSLGEYSALTCAGVLQFSDAVKIVAKRGQLAQEEADAQTGAMTIIDKIDAAVVEDECIKASIDSEKVYISCFNSPAQVAVSGHREAVRRVEDRVLELGGQISPLMDSAPFHSPLMINVADKLHAELEKYPIGNFRYPVISNVTGKPYSSKSKVIKLLTDQIMYPVQWQNTMKYFEAYGITVVVDMGSMNVLDTLVAANTKGLKSFCFGDKENRKALTKQLLSSSNMSRSVPTFITKCLAAAVSLPNLNYNNDEYQKGVVEPYKKIQDMQITLEKLGLPPSKEQMDEAINALLLIMKTKKVFDEEQKEVISQIIEETGTTYYYKELVV